jgi:hypothetical protein
MLAVLPVAADAQTAPTPANQEVVVKESTTVVVKEAPKPSPFTFTPYGFFLVNAYFNDAIGARAYPLPNPCTSGVACEGNILFDVRQTRLGSRLSFNDTAGWTGATLSALVEVDFNGGYTGAVAASSAGFYNPAIRLRKAYANAAWGSESMIQLRVGQDDRLISPLRPVSLAYVANPLFQNAGLLHGRAPMFQLRWDLHPKDGIAVSVAGAALNPQDNTAGDNGVSPGAAVDLGAGNRSRIPNLEGRIGVGLRSGGKNVVALGGWAGWQKNRYVSPASDTNVDANSYIFGGDLTLNVAFVQLMGEIYKAKGYDVPGSLGASQGVALSFTRPTPTTFAISAANPVPAFGGWFQIAARPIEALQIYGGWGGTQSPFDAYAGTVFDATAATRAATRLQNFMWAAGVIGYAGKNWRFSAEYGRATSYFLSGLNYTQGQFSINSQLTF